MAVGTTTSAALCTVTASNDVLQKDVVLHLMLQQAQLQTHQVKLKVAKSPKQTLVATLADTSIQIQQRNAILRSIYGAALHGALNLWSGGGSMVGPHTTTSTTAMMNHKALTYWMRAASASTSIDMAELEQTLQQSAFLVPYAASCTLADLDVAVALLQRSSRDDVSTYPTAVQRWMYQVCAVLSQLSKETGVDLSHVLPPPNVATPPVSMPVFFDGSEDADALLDSLYKPSSKQPKGKGGGGGGGGDGKKQNKKDANKKDKKAESATQQKQAAAATTADYDISALDIRVGKITKVWAHESADKLFCEEIDLGNGETRQIASGLRAFYKETDLQDRLVLVLCNLKKRNLVGFPSHGMVLCASNADHTAVEFVVPPPDTKIGERVTFEGIDPETAPEPENKVAKKKIFEKLAPDLKTNAAGHVVWKTDHVAKTSAGIVQALNGMPNASVS